MAAFYRSPEVLIQLVLRISFHGKDTLLVQDLCVLLNKK